MKRFIEYVRLREISEPQSDDGERDAGADSEPEVGAQSSLQPAIRIACEKFPQRIKQFLKELGDSDIDKAMSHVPDDHDDDTGPIRRSDRDKNRDSNMIVVPKADGNPGAENGGWD